MREIDELIGNQPGMGFSIYSFRDRMLEMCAADHRAGRALVFAFFIYDFQDAQIIKVLQDRDYWAAFNEISGSAITVFACNSPTPREGPLKEVATQIRRNLKAICSEILGPDIRFESPSLLFFQIRDGKVIDSLFVRLGEMKTEDSFIEAREILKQAAESLANVAEENRGNVQETFNLVEQALSQRRIVKAVMKGAAVIKVLKELLKPVAG